MLALFFGVALTLASPLMAALPDADRSEFRVRTWSTAEGLPQNTINEIVQTRDGYLWIATFGGLVRFDGVRFVVYNTANAPALKSSRVTALHEDRQAILWAATESGEISCLRDGVFYPFDSGESEQIYSLFADSRGYLWAGGANGARRYRLPENRCGAPVGDFERIKPPPHGNQSSDQISTILEAADGAVWLANFGVSEEKTGRILLWRENGPLEVFDPSVDLPETLYGKSAARIFVWDIALEPGPEDGAPETLWVADRNGLLRFDGKHFVREFAETQISADRFRFARDAEGRLLVNLSDRVARLNGAGKWETSAAPEIAGQAARVFFCDLENNLWLGTNASGLLQLQPKFIDSFDESSGVAKNQTAAVLQDSGGTLWIAGYGLHRFEGGRFVRDKSVPEANLLSLAELRDGSLVIGGYNVLLRRRADGVVTDLSGELTRLFGDAPFAVKAIHEDSRGDWWLGLRDQGVLRRDTQGNYRQFQTADGLSGNQVQYIAEGRNGALWFATLGGASKFENDRFTNLTIADGLASDNVRAVLETTDGTVYLGTYGGGLSRFRDGRMRTLTTAAGLCDDVVSRLIVDGSDNFWMLGNAGVSKASRRELDRAFDEDKGHVLCRSFDATDGMLAAEGNGGSQPAGWPANDGSLWFPTIRGYVRIRPPVLDPRPPPVVIETVKVDDGIVDQRAPVVIKADDQNLEIRYTGLSFKHSEQLRFRYKLEGFDRDWVDAGTRRTAYFSSPPAGEFVFRVQAANIDGVWNEQTASLRLKVLPPFYRTNWFLALAVLVVAGGAYAIYAFRISRIEQARRTQEVFSRRLIQLQEEERQRIAGDLHDSLSQNLVIITNRARIALQRRGDTDDVYEQVEEIAEAAQESLVEVREIAANLRPFVIDRLGLSMAIEAMARKIERPDLRIDAKVDDIDGLLAPEMEINLYRIVQECLNNVVKHSGASEAAVEITRRAKSISVLVRDNGRGFDVEEVERTERTNAGGFGLMGISERGRILGAVPMIESNPEDGTSVRLTIAI